MKEHIEKRSFPAAAVICLAPPTTRRASLRCAAAAAKDFFFFQLRMAASKGRVPIAQVDHPLDKSIAFQPRKVSTYLDFVAFWARAAAFLLERYGRRGEADTVSFIDGMGRLYSSAASIYKHNLSTTKRPSYLLHPSFLFIALTDPHLLCVPSLHVMIVIRAYTHFREIIHKRGEEEALAEDIAMLREGAVAITEAVLYVKQHSVNCISASLYTMTRFDPALFPPDEAERFASDLFRSCRNPSEENAAGIRAHIISLYRRFLEEGRKADDWRTPILKFLARQPRFG
jgi:hypothetical protein